MKAWNSRPICSSVMPMPLSVTAKADTRLAVVARRRARTSSVTLPSLVNFAALLSRLMRLCLSLVRSVRNDADIGGQSIIEPVAVLAPSAASTMVCTSSTSLPRSTAPDRHPCGPASIFDRSRMSLIRPSRCLPARLDLLRGRRCSRVVAAVGGVFEQDFAVADDGVERRAQLVAHIGEERRLGARRRLRVGARLLGLLLAPSGSRGHCRGTPRARGSCRRARPGRPAGIGAARLPCAMASMLRDSPVSRATT